MSHIGGQKVFSNQFTDQTGAFAPMGLPFEVGPCLNIHRLIQHLSNQRGCRLSTPTGSGSHIRGNHGPDREENKK